MTDSEIGLFESFLRKAGSYVEFGAGGSSYLAAQHVKKILSVDSDPAWLASVSEAISGLNNGVEFLPHAVDIGPTGDWGAPINPEMRSKWPAYSLSVWNIPDSREADLYLIDGRFRVSCFAEVIARARVGCFIAIHDFENREHYHKVKKLARYIAVSETLSVFVKEYNANISEAERLAHEYRYIWQ